MAHRNRSAEEIIAERKAALKAGKAKSAFGDVVEKALERQEKVAQLEDATAIMEIECEDFRNNIKALSKKDKKARRKLSKKSQSSSNTAAKQQAASTPEKKPAAVSAPETPLKGKCCSCDASCAPSPSQGHHVFDIKFERDGKTFECCARYSELLKTHEECLHKCGNNNSHLKFPPKKFFGHRDEKFVQQRSKDFEKYFKTVANDPTLAELWSASPLFKCCS